MRAQQQEGRGRQWHIDLHPEDVEPEVAFEEDPDATADSDDEDG